MKRHDKFYVYMLQDKNGAFYTGYTADIKKRIALHEKGLGAKYLNGRKPLKLVFQKESRYYKTALNAERKIKQYTRDRKEDLVKIFSQEDSGTI